MLKIIRCVHKVDTNILKVLQTKISNSSLQIRNGSSFTTTQVTIPTLQGNITGILWEPGSKPLVPSVPVICVHGIQDNCGSFDPLLPLLIKENPRTFFAVDLPGHGHSYHTSGLHYDLVEFIFALQIVFQHFKWTTAVLLGHSLGSIINFIFTAAFPHMVDKYIALDNMRPVPSDNLGVLYGRHVQSVMKTQSILQSGKERPSFTYSDILDKIVTARDKVVTKEGCEILLKRGAENIPGTNRFRFTHDVRLNVPMPFKFHSAEQSSIMAKTFRCPVCVIKGDDGFDYEPREDFVKAVEDIGLTNPSRVEYHTVPGTHHFHLNTPDIVVPIISKFLNS